MRECPRCGGSLARGVVDGKEVERCTRCPYHVFIVPLDRTRIVGPRYGNLWPVGEKA